MIKQAVILDRYIAGDSSCCTVTSSGAFIEIDGISIVERSVKKLIDEGIEEIIIAAGCCAEQYYSLAKKYHIIKVLLNEDFASTGSIGNLSLCASLIKGDFLIVYSDLLYDGAGISVLLNDFHSNVMLAGGKTDSKCNCDLCIKADESGALIDVFKCEDNHLNSECSCVFTGILKLSKACFDALMSLYIQNESCNDSSILNYEYMLCKVCCNEEKMYVRKLEYYVWMKLDDETVLNRALTDVYPRIAESEQMHSIRREVLLNPGPATTTDSVKYAQVQSDICPREYEFGDLMEWCATELTKVVADPDEYTTVMFGCSGTGADEAMVCSVVPENGKLLVIDNGSYGNRIAKIAGVHKLDYDVFTSSTYEPIDLNALEKKIAEGKYTHLAGVYHETTTGLLNPIKEICQIAKKYGLVTIFDAVSAYAGIPMNMKEIGVDFIASTSNKNIQGMAGIGFVVCNKKALEATKNIPIRNYYLNLWDQYQYFQKTHQTRFTPPVQTFYALRQAIIETKVETVERRAERYIECWKVLVETIKKIGLKMLVKEEYQSHLITAILEPESTKYSFEALHDFARRHQFTIYPGKLGNINTFRIANIGDIQPEEMKAFCIKLEEFMKDVI